MHDLPSCGVQMVLESCLASLLHCSYITFGVDCISKLLDANLITDSKLPDLCDAVCPLPSLGRPAILALFGHDLDREGVQHACMNRRLDSTYASIQAFL